MDFQSLGSNLLSLGKMEGAVASNKYVSTIDLIDNGFLTFHKTLVRLIDVVCLQLCPSSASLLHRIARICLLLLLGHVLRSRVLGPDSCRNHACKARRLATRKSEINQTRGGGVCILSPPHDYEVFKFWTFLRLRRPGVPRAGQEANRGSEAAQTPKSTRAEPIPGGPGTSRFAPSTRGAQGLANVAARPSTAPKKPQTASEPLRLIDPEQV